MILALLVLFSTLSFTVEKHLCGGKVVDVAVFGNLIGCGMPDENPRNTLLAPENDPCCNDVVHFVAGSNADLKAAQKASVKTVQFPLVFNQTYDVLYQQSEKTFNTFLSYRSPIVVKDIPVLYETFLI